MVLSGPVGSLLLPPLLHPTCPMTNTTDCNSAVPAEGDVRSLEERRKPSRCEEMLQFSLDRCPRVKFLREKLEKLGCELPRPSFVCRPCEGLEVSGGFVPPKEDGKGNYSLPEVVLCNDKEVTQTMMDHTMAHELIHAYDQCRIKIDWSNCLHLACTEIRAANTSGECSFNMELRRGHTRWGGQQKECVKRRAELSVKAHPGCSERAREFVDSAFTPCYYDTEPYDKNPL